MAQVTTLHPTGVSGVPYSFSAKAPAAEGPHTGGPFTQLHLTATPGMRFSFTAKGEAIVADTPSGGHYLPKKKKKRKSTAVYAPERVTPELKEKLKKVVKEAPEPKAKPEPQKPGKTLSDLNAAYKRERTLEYKLAGLQKRLDEVRRLDTLSRKQKWELRRLQKQEERRLLELERVRYERQLLEDELLLVLLV